jgi:hypothetical protein
LRNDLGQLASVNGMGSGFVLDTGDMPCGRAGLGGLAEEEAELLQALGEDVLARHGDGMAGVGRSRGITTWRDERTSYSPRR